MPANLLVLCPLYLPHAALAELAGDFVMSKIFADQEHAYLLNFVALVGKLKSPNVTSPYESVSSLVC